MKIRPRLRRILPETIPLQDIQAQERHVCHPSLVKIPAVNQPPKVVEYRQFVVMDRKVVALVWRILPEVHRGVPRTSYALMPAVKEAVKETPSTPMTRGSVFLKSSTGALVSLNHPISKCTRHAKARRWIILLCSSVSLCLRLLEHGALPLSTRIKHMVLVECFQAIRVVSSYIAK